MEVIDEAAEAPFVVNMDCGRAVDTPDIASALLVGHGPVRCGFFRAAAVPHELRSPEADMATPFV